MVFVVKILRDSVVKTCRMGSRKKRWKNTTNFWWDITEREKNVQIVYVDYRIIFIYKWRILHSWRFKVSSVSKMTTYSLDSQNVVFRFLAAAKNSSLLQNLQTDSCDHAASYLCKPPCSTGVNNEWSSSFTPAYALLGRIWTACTVLADHIIVINDAFNPRTSLKIQLFLIMHLNWRGP